MCQLTANRIASAVYRNMPALVAAVVFAVTATDAQSGSMVLVMNGDGTLTPSASQSSFARNYNDGVGQGTAGQRLNVLGQQVNAPSSGDIGTSSARIPKPVSPIPEVLNAIDKTALRYASHPALRLAGLSVSDWRLLLRSNIEIESAYNRKALSKVGAIGLGQLMPQTARDLGVDPHDWRQNLDGSARYLLMMLAQFGDAQLALAAYNAGPGAVERHSGIPPYKETKNHVSRVLGVFKRLKGELS